MRGFNFQPSLVSETVLLRPLLKGDYGGLYLCASDRRLWAGYPSKERYKETEFRKWFTNAIQSKAALVIVDAKTNDIIGSSRFYIEDSSPKDICIGYTFISRQYWGGAINYDVKKIMLDYVFEYFNVVWFHIATSNIRSQKAIQKIGGIFSHKASRPVTGNCEPWIFYKIEKYRWP